MVDTTSPHALWAEAIVPAEAPDPSAGQQGPQAVEVPSPTRVEQPDTLTSVKPRPLTLKPDTHTLTKDNIDTL